MDSFVLSGETKEDDKLEYMVFVWNGKNTSASVKSTTMSKAYELESYIKTSQGPFLEVLFSGGIFKDGKLKTGSILQLIRNQNRRSDNKQQFNNVHEKVYLFKFLFPKRVSFPVPEMNGAINEKFAGKDQEHTEWSKNWRERPLSERGNETRRGYDQNESGHMSERDRGQPKQLAVNSGKVMMPGLKLGGMDNRGQNGNNKLEKVEFKLQMGDRDNWREHRRGDDPSEDEEEGQASTPRRRESDELDSYERNNSRSQEVNTGIGKSQELPFKKLAIPKIGGIGGIGGAIGGSQAGHGGNSIPSLNLGSLPKKVPEEFCYEDLVKEDEPGYVDYDIPESVRKQLKLERFKHECSEVIPDLIYLGGNAVAQNYDTLKQFGITHILNCAGNYCQNSFTDEFNYKTYYLKDAKNENIEAIFYDCVDYINDVKNSGGRVYIHCEKGISRSATVTLAYLMLTEKMNFNDAFEFVKGKRGIISPNLGFIAQLMMFHQRLYEDYSKLRINPKVFAISSHQVEDPGTLIARLLFEEQLYSAKNIHRLDPRGVFIITNSQQSYIWVGSECHQSYKQKYIDFALSYSERLIKHEHMPANPQIIKQDQEPEKFWSIFGLKDLPEEKYSYNRFWDKWYQNLNENRGTSSRSQRSKVEYSDKEELEDRPAGFKYPNFIEPMYVMDYDDLQEDTFLMVCVKQVNKIYTWRGPEFFEEEITLKEFMAGVLHNYFGECDLESLEWVEVEPNAETEEFQQFF